MAWGDDTRVQWPETLYSFSLTRLGNLRVNKWAGGKEPVASYIITSQGKGKCDCLGSIRQPYCKHRKIVDAVDRICTQGGFKVWGCFYDYDQGILYTPADGEGVPIDNSWMTEVIKHARTLSGA